MSCEFHSAAVGRWSTQPSSLAAGAVSRRVQVAAVPGRNDENDNRTHTRYRTWRHCAHVVCRDCAGGVAAKAVRTSVHKTALLTPTQAHIPTHAWPWTPARSSRQPFQPKREVPALTATHGCMGGGVKGRRGSGGLVPGTVSSTYARLGMDVWGS